MTQEIQRTVEQKFGPGSYENAIAKVKPHRCAKHFEAALDKWWHGHWDGMSIFWDCLSSTPGNEPVIQDEQSFVFNKH